MKNLRVWNYSLDLAEEIYELTNAIVFKRDPSFRDQIRRAAVSVASNIGEGHERGSNKDSIRFFNIAKASVAEVITQLYIAYRIKYISSEVLKALEDKSERIKASLINLIKSRKQNDLSRSSLTVNR